MTETKDEVKAESKNHEDTSPAANSKGKPWLARLTTGLMLLLGLGVLSIFLCSLLGRFFLVPELMSNFRLQIVGLTLPMGVIVYLTGVWRWLAWVLIGVSIWSLLTLAFVFVPAKQPPPGPKPIKVMSYNVLGHNPKRSEVIRLIKETDPDVLLVLEYARNWNKKLKPLYETYPHRILQPRWHGFGMALLSKYPVSDEEVVMLARDTTDNPSIVATIDFGDQKIRFAGIHSISPRNQFRYDLRNRQFSDLASHVAKDKKIPTVVMGDFNCVTWSPYLKDFLYTTGYRDSRRGFGYQASWPVKYPLLRIPIDHAFVSKDVHVHSRKTGVSIGSDHLPIIFQVSTAKK